MSSLREAMIRADASEEQDARIAHAVSRALVETPPDEDNDATVRRELAEVERLAREDAFSGLAMEIIARARSMVGRTKWSSTEGLVKRRIVEALRCLPSDD
jgi:hypothetical protein